MDLTVTLLNKLFLHWMDSKLLCDRLKNNLTELFVGSLIKKRIFYKTKCELCMV